MQKQFNISYETSQEEILPDELSPFKYRLTPFSSSSIFLAPILGYEVITDEDDRKVFNLKISRKNLPFEFKAGDTIGVLPSNDDELVNKLILRLGLENVADQHYQLCIDPNNNKKKVILPKHIPRFGTLRNILLNNVSLNSVPKKGFLKSLMNYTNDEEDRQQFSVLCAPKTTMEYTRLISSFSDRGLFSLLQLYPSCHPPIEVILEHLPALLPRPYSISSSPLNEEYLSITFDMESSGKGVCVSWLEKSIKKFKGTGSCELPIYLRTSSKFMLPKDNSVPIIMIATGTGIAPFRGFLEHRHLQIDQKFGKSWLFYGCRNSQEDFLFQDDLEIFLASGALSKISVCFSRESEKKQYVQDLIEKYADELGGWILRDEAILYVCGNFQKVVPAVRKAILEVVAKNMHLHKEEAEIYLKKMEENGRYIVDSWI